MSNRLRYEEQLQQQWQDLPLPDENMAWEDMRRRLEEDDDDGIIVWWKKGCAGWGLLLIALLSGGWWLWTSTRTNAVSEQIVEKEITIQQRLPVDSAKANPLINKYDSSTEAIPERFIYPDQHRVEKVRKNTPAESYPVKEEVPEDSSAGASRAQSYAISVTDTVIASSDSVIKKDTVANKTDSLVKENKKDSTIKKPLFLSAGIALQQQLPVAGQQWTPYNASGRKGSLSDYIPSVYFRITRKDKWFIQTEFRYGAPQYSNDILFQQTVVPDTGANPVNSTVSSARLKKTYYHQLPVSFNYFILPNWSLGTGVQLNRFSAAVTEKVASRRDNLSQTDTVISKTIVVDKSDSITRLFNKTYFQGIIETQYEWKRFSLGARYTFGLQPYLKFTLPGGSPQQEKNSSLQVFLRYRLWKGREF